MQVARPVFQWAKGVIIGLVLLIGIAIGGLGFSSLMSDPDPVRFKPGFEQPPINSDGIAWEDLTSIVQYAFRVCH